MGACLFYRMSALDPTLLGYNDDVLKKCSNVDDSCTVTATCRRTINSRWAQTRAIYVYCKRENAKKKRLITGYPGWSIKGRPCDHGLPRKKAKYRGM